MTPVAETFFVAGGTVPPGSPSYVERAADRELFSALLEGEYCYVLNSRQMGKSSLAVRTVSRLQEAGARTAFVDLTRIGGANVSAEQWYAGLLVETGRVLELRHDAVSYLREHKEVGGAQRYLSFLHEVALPAEGSPLVVMLDEIDAVRSLSFSTDELFAGIRQLHNGRASDPDLERLTFCLLGAALPGDLIRDARTTPFNVGRRIELRDFTPEEASAFEAGLSSRLRRPAAALASEPASAPVARVMHWTGGHPFLTQSLCSALAEPRSQEPLSPSAVDALVRERYLDARARETDTNLADVGNRLLARGDPNVGDAERADTLSLYEKLLKGGIPDDESNPSCARIKMSGVARLEQGHLRIRNRIYQEVFGREWIRENMPGQELRRQRKAFWKGVIRTGSVAGVVVATVAGLAIAYASAAEAARRQRDQARYEAYVATMANVDSIAEQNDLSLLQETLESQRAFPRRGWEWDYWNEVAHGGSRTILLHDSGYREGSIALSADRRHAYLLHRSGRRLADVELKTGQVHVVELWDRKGVGIGVLADGGIAVWTESGHAKIVREGGKRIRDLPTFPGTKFALAFGRSLVGFDRKGYMEVDTDHPASPPRRSPMADARRVEAAASPDGRYVSWQQFNPDGGKWGLVVFDRKVGKIWRTLADTGRWCSSVWTPDGKEILLNHGLHHGWMLCFYDPWADRIDTRRGWFQATFNHAAISPDGRHVIATGYDNVSLVFDAARVPEDRSGPGER